MCMVFAEQMPVWDFYTAVKYKKNDNVRHILGQRKKQVSKHMR